MASNCNLVHDQNSPKIAFWTLSLWGLCRLLQLSVFDFVLNHGLQATLFAQIATFTPWFQEGETYLSLFTALSCFHLHTQAAHEATVATPLLHHLCIPVLRRRTICCLQRSFLHLCPQGPTTLFSMTYYTCMFLKVLLKTQVSDSLNLVKTNGCQPQAGYLAI